MRTFKQHLNERADQIAVILGMIDAGRFAGAPELVAYMNAKKYTKQIGKGLFSVVMDDARSTGKHVMKIQRLPRVGAFDVYPNFVKLANKRQFMNPLYPSVDFFRQFKDGSYVAFIERLTLDPDGLDDLFRPLSGDLYNTTKREVRVFQQSGPFSYVSLLAFPEMVTDREYWKEVMEPFFLQACGLLKVPAARMRQFIREAMRVPGMNRWDAHNENVGFRGDGSPVFFDPIV